MNEWKPCGASQSGRRGPLPAAPDLGRNGRAFVLLILLAGSLRREAFGQALGGFPLQEFSGERRTLHRCAQGREAWLPWAEECVWAGGGGESARPRCVRACMPPCVVCSLPAAWEHPAKSAGRH